MSTSAITSATNSSSVLTDPSTSALPTQTLGENDFLKLLVTQMTSQDPLNPTKDTDFIAQMAQFTSLQQTKTMEADLAGMRGDQQLSQANGLIGRVVSVQADANSPLLQGVVSGVQIQAGTPKLLVNGTSYDLSQLVGVLPAPTQ